MVGGLSYDKFMDSMAEIPQRYRGVWAADLWQKAGRAYLMDAEFYTKVQLVLRMMQQHRGPLGSAHEGMVQAACLALVLADIDDLGALTGS